MCGLLGYFAMRDRKPLSKWIREGIQKLSHRGPDSEGFWFSKDGEIGLAHKRLAIIDLTPAGNQPMISSDGQVVLVFNGNIYNYIELRSELIQKGAIFIGDSDTEVLLQGYIYWGSEFVTRLHGFFAFVIWDNHKKTMVVGRDRLGEKPFYYHIDDHHFIFGSEPRAMPENFSKLNIDLTSIVDFLVFGFVPSPKTMWKEMSKLEPAHIIKITAIDGRLLAEQKRYWVPRLNCTHLKREDEMVEGIRHYCEEAATKVVRSDVPVGCLLSGGVDSSCVVAFVARQYPNSLLTLTVGYKHKFDESPWARRIAERYAVVNDTKLCTTEDVQLMLEDKNLIYDEPFDDGSQIAARIIFSKASQRCKVVLTGDGADELFCGYQIYPKLDKLIKFKKICPSIIWNKPLKILRKLLHRGSNLDYQIYRFLATNDELLMELASNAIRPRDLPDILSWSIRNYDPRIHIIQKLSEVGGEDPMTQLRYLGITYKLPEQMMFKIDRAAMAFSVESRPFFLYTPLMEFALSLPTEKLIRRGGKYLLKKACEPFVPLENLYRQKRGFGLKGIDCRDWFNKERDLVLQQKIGVSYSKVLARTSIDRQNRLYFGARSLYDWLSQEKAAFNFP